MRGRGHLIAEGLCLGVRGGAFALREALARWRQGGCAGGSLGGGEGGGGEGGGAGGSGGGGAGGGSAGEGDCGTTSTITWSLEMRPSALDFKQQLCRPSSMGAMVMLKLAALLDETNESSDGCTGNWSHGAPSGTR